MAGSPAAGGKNTPMSRTTETAYHCSTLPGGLRVVSETIPHVRSVSAGVWVAAGSRHEGLGKGGTSHFIEHLVFKGTKNRTARRIAEEIEAVGGQLNAFTAKEFTCFYCRVLDDHLDLALDVLADMLVNSLFDPRDVERERGVILEEIRLYQDTPDEYVHDLFAEALWGEHPLGRAVVGSSGEIGELSRQDILDYFRRFYTPDKMVLAAAGNVEHERLLACAGRVFEGLVGTMCARDGPRPKAQNGISIVRKPTEQVHLCLGGEGVALNDDEFFTLHVLNALLGAGSSSRLFQEIREDRGLAYSVYSYETAYSDTGLFAIYAGMSPACAGEVVELAQKELARVRNGEVDASELSRAKEQMRCNLMLSLESTSNRMTRLGKLLMLLGDVPTPEQAMESIMAVTRDDVTTLARRIMRDECLALAAVGPVAEEVERSWRRSR